MIHYKVLKMDKEELIETVVIIRMTIWRMQRMLDEILLEEEEWKKTWDGEEYDY